MQHDARLTDGGWWGVNRYLGNAKIQGPLFKKGASLSLTLSHVLLMLLRLKIDCKT